MPGGPWRRPNCPARRQAPVGLAVARHLDVVGAIRKTDPVPKSTAASVKVPDAIETGLFDSPRRLLRPRGGRNGPPGHDRGV